MTDTELYQRAWRSYSAGDLPRAWQQCQQLLRASEEDPRSWDLASRVALATGARRQALEWIDRALSYEAESFASLSQKAYCLLALKELESAGELIERLAGRELVRAAELDTLGNLFSAAGDQHRASDCFQRAVALDGERSHYQLNLGLALQATGEISRAEVAFDRAIELDPSAHEAWLHRSRLRTQVADNNHVDALNTQLRSGTADWRGEVALRYALAKELEDLGKFAQGFRQLALAAGSRRRHMDYDARADLAAMDEIRAVYTSEWVAQDRAGCDSAEPIFIVGLPRTGTTLVERILGSHSQVYAAGELNNFAECLTAALAGDKPANRIEFIRRSAEADLQALGSAYVHSTRPQTGHTARFVDKLPLNFLYCGLIATALPNARIIHLCRHPMDTCYAIYKTLFKQAYPFSYDLEELADYYQAYRQLMAHWRQVLTGRILDVHYEQLATDTEVQSRMIIDHCGLDWEQACLEFHRSSTPSMTASLAQVRKPVYRSSIGKWRGCREELAPLESRLRSAGVDF